jgi:prepilin-type N-terminal cleavage/methylation domain-containing protein
MALHKTYISSKKQFNHGFTLIEVLVVLTLLSIVFGSTLFFTADTYQRTAFLSERDNLVSVLQTARAKALNNVNQSKHGVALYPDGYSGYVVFEGYTLASSDILSRIYIASSYAVIVDGVSPNEIVFEQLSGNASYDGQITLIDQNRMATTSFSINHDGAISR